MTMHALAIGSGVVIAILLCVIWELVQRTDGLKRRADYYYNEFVKQWEVRNKDHELLMAAVQDNIRLRRRLRENDQTNEV